MCAVFRRFVLVSFFIKSSSWDSGGVSCSIHYARVCAHYARGHMCAYIYKFCHVSNASHNRPLATSGEFVKPKVRECDGDALCFDGGALQNDSAIHVLTDLTGDTKGRQVHSRSSGLRENNISVACAQPLLQNRVGEALTVSA